MLLNTSFTLRGEPIVESPKDAYNTFVRSGMDLRGKIIIDLFSFFWENKLWWLLPMLGVITIVGVLIIFANSTPLAPFVYPLF